MNDTTNASEGGTGSRTVELYVMAAVHEAAKARAMRLGQPLSAVARMVLAEAAKHAPAEPPKGVRQPNNYLTGQGEMKRVRFTFPRDEYSAVALAIKNAGSYPNFALEDGLESYARTGTLYPPKDIREKNRRRRLKYDLGYPGRPRPSKTDIESEITDHATAEA